MVNFIIKCDNGQEYKVKALEEGHFDYMIYNSAGEMVNAVRGNYLIERLPFMGEHQKLIEVKHENEAIKIKIVEMIPVF